MTKSKKKERPSQDQDQLDEVLATIKASMTMPEVAKATGFHIETLRKWARSGELKTFKVANVVRVHRADLAKFLEHRMTKEEAR